MKEDTGENKPSVKTYRQGLYEGLKLSLRIVNGYAKKDKILEVLESHLNLLESLHNQ